jgi:hypothetical protein
VTRWVMALRERLQCSLLMGLLHACLLMQAHVARVPHSSACLLKLPSKLLLSSPCLLLFSGAQTTLQGPLSPVLCLAGA